MCVLHCVISGTGDFRYLNKIDSLRKLLNLFVPILIIRTIDSQLKIQGWFITTQYK